MKYITLKRVNEILQPDLSARNIPRSPERMLVVIKPVGRGESFCVGFVSPGIYKFRSLAMTAVGRHIEEGEIS